MTNFVKILATPTASANLVHTTARGAYGAGCFGHGRFGRGGGRGRARGSPLANRPKCQVCNKPGHISLNCWYRFEEDYAPQPPPNHTEASHQNHPPSQQATQQESTFTVTDQAP